jgi:hypothetical protein
MRVPGAAQYKRADRSVHAGIAAGAVIGCSWHTAPR